ncbi:ImmA/IrrE family metallo-endopeptidase [Sphingobium terrigena]|uniref:ImmA/IrrE family metallo-endopeptidase n=1 Tax=Sphingobium terrigena TaxID=2304063 RepID=A0A418YYT5_9SPHN|nr:ImmA/IrrE family metallo-endopeptidase [Sphingobium terrigena]RJG57985.1 ImmA/IrrE family metallo-endopeptidase [Sphingobium terrigena]
MVDPMTVIAQHWNSTPVPIEAIIRDIGLPLSYEPMDDNISGYIERQNGSYRIVVNSSHAPTRQRFTAAHELGHYIYHRDLLGEGVGDNRAYRTEGTDRPNLNIRPIHERQANSFAANVLMPRHRLSDVAEQSTAALAARFAVSQAAMKIRLGR